MRTLIIILMALTLNGCVRATYNASEAEGESFYLWSFLKSVDGLYTERTLDGRFNLKIDKTHSQDPTSNMLKMMELMYGIRPINPPQTEEVE